MVDETAESHVTVEDSPLNAVKAPDTRQTRRFESDELTHRCPVDFGEPDFYHLLIEYEGEHSIETGSLSNWIHTFRDRSITTEELATEVFDTVVGTIDPTYCKVKLSQRRQGSVNLEIEIEETYE